MSPKSLEYIDREGGLVLRATYIEYCLKQYFEFRDNARKFYHELLAMLPEKVTGEDIDKLRTILENIRSKIMKRKRSTQPQKTF